MAEESSGSNQSTDVDLGVSGLHSEEDSRELEQKTDPGISGSKATNDGEYSGSIKATGDAGSNGSNQVSDFIYIQNCTCMYMYIQLN